MLEKYKRDLSNTLTQYINSVSSHINTKNSVYTVSIMMINNRVVVPPASSSVLQILLQPR